LKLQTHKLPANYAQIGYQIAMCVLIKLTVLHALATILLKMFQRVSTRAVLANCPAFNAWELLQIALTVTQEEH
jgi:hypothetical protein